MGLTINVGQFSLLFLGMKVGTPAGLASLVLQAQVFYVGNFGYVARSTLELEPCAGVGFGFTIAAAASWEIGNIIMSGLIIHIFGEKLRLKLGL